MPDDALDYSPDHAAALGRLLGHWGVLETHLTRMMEYLLKVDHHRADFVYKEFTATKTKITLLLRLNHHFIQDKLLKEEIKELLIKAKNLNKERNAFVHARWGGGAYGANDNKIYRINIGAPFDYKELYNPMYKFTPQDIQKVVEDIAKLSLSFQALLDRILADEKE